MGVLHWGERNSPIDTLFGGGVLIFPEYVDIEESIMDRFGSKEVGEVGEIEEKNGVENPVMLDQLGRIGESIGHSGHIMHRK